MNTKEVIKLSADTSYVPIKYFVMECNVGSAADSTYLWLKVIAYGIDTIENYDAYITSLDTSVIDMTGFQGTLGVYTVVALTAVEQYTSPKSNHTVHPVG